MKTRIAWQLVWFSVAVLAFLAGLGTDVLAAEQPTGRHPSGPALCQLNIEGKLIEQLTLERRSDPRLDPTHFTAFDRPGPTLTLPAGEYRVQEILLQGGYSCTPPQFIGDRETGTSTEAGWFTLSPEKPHLLRVGAPLKPTLLVDRRGRDVMLECQLVDAEAAPGWQYSRRAGSPPQFTVYHGQRAIGSGSFEYG